MESIVAFEFFINRSRGIAPRTVHSFCAPGHEKSVVKKTTASVRSLPHAGVAEW